MVEDKKIPNSFGKYMRKKVAFAKRKIRRYEVVCVWKDIKFAFGQIRQAIGDRRTFSFGKDMKSSRSQRR
jgi:hypothetical protein